MNQNGSFNDLFGLCGPCGARRGIGLWTNNDFTVNVVKTVCVFSTGQLPNRRARGPNCKHLRNSAREMNTQCFEVLGLGYCRTPSLCGILKPSRSLCTQQPKPQGGLGKPIHQSNSVYRLGGTKATHETNHYKPRWDHSWTAYPHKEKGPLFVFGQGLSSKVWWKTNVWFHRWMRRRSWMQHGSFNSPATQRLEYFPHVRWLMQLCCDV